MTDTHGYLEGSADAASQSDSQKAIQYKKVVCKNFMNISADQIDYRLGGSEYFVTRKYDGEMNVLFYDGDQAAIINRSGRIRIGLPCTEDAKAALKKAGISQAVMPAELYACESEGRTRVFHVLNALADKKKIGALHLAVFDVLEIDDEPFRSNSYKDTLAKIKEIFVGAKLCSAVESKECKSKSEVKDIYADWVENGGAEGLVVRTDLPLVYKVKPRHNIDVAVVGYSEGAGDQKGQVRTLLLAMMPSEHEYQIIGKTGNGFDEDTKKELFDMLEPLTVDSDYIETDSNHVAFHMIRPEIVIELMINDVVFDTPSGMVENPVLLFESDMFIRKGNVHGISVIYPIFVRLREDKKAVHEDVRLTQINDFSYYAPEAVSDSGTLEKSDLLKRIVYKKESGSKLMVQKFVVWKTNKPAPDYPAYVYHYTNFSSERKEPLQREVIVSESEEQIMELYEQSLATNVKKGWKAVD